MINEFYKKVLPSSGTYCIGAANGGMVHHFVESVDEISDKVSSLLRDGTHMYFAVGSFDGHSRRKERAIFFRSLFLDVDVGDGKDYKTKQEAQDALDKLILDEGLPQPIKVDSGRGIHAYWCLDEDIPAAKYVEYSKKLRDFCLDKGLHVDTAVMGDAARIMRCPDTFNYKDNPPLPTKILSDTLPVYKLEEIDNFLGSVQESLESILAQAKGKMSEDQRKMLKLDNFTSKFQTIAIKSLQGKGCNQITNILKNAKDIEEPSWYAGLSIAQHCEDRDEAIHTMSEEHPGYSREETEKKANQAQDKPFTCTAFAELNSSLCEGCEHRGKITTPLQLGKEFKAAPVADNFQLPKEYVDKNVPSIYASYPKEIYPFMRGVNGGIYFEYPQEIDDEGQPLPRKKPLLVYPHDFEPIKRIYSPVDGECLEMQVSLPNDGVRKFILPMKAVYAIDKFRDAITSQGILFSPSQQQGKFLMEYVYKWGEYLINSTKADIMRVQMGWTPDMKAFVIGNKEITNKGEILNAPTSTALANGISNLLEPSGEYSVWQDTINKLNMPGLELHAFTMLTAFGSPLMNKTSTNGVTISLTGADSGTGKSGSLYAANSVWGHGRDLSVGGIEGATGNGMTGRYLALKNMTFGLDEVGNLDGRELSSIVHKISTGKAKIRMQASVNAERMHEFSASMIAIFTSNHSLYDKISTYKKNANGEVARLIEFNMKKPKCFDDDPTLGVTLFQPLNTNHGHAGTEYIKALFKYTDEDITSKIDKYIKKIKVDFGDDSTYRFWENAVAATFAGAEIANEASIVKFELDHIYDAIISQLINLRDNVFNVNNIDYENILSEYINENISGLLAFENGNMSMEPRSSLIMRAEIDESLFCIEKKHLREYFAKQGVSIQDFIFKMKSLGYNIVEHKRRMGTGWKSATGFSAVTCIEIDTTKFLDDILLETEEKVNAAK